ncbi:hypothetical protein BDP27DRAFT_1214976 [Rhodocollybia butyracea]|uniref:DUF6593 domain-containing protein n=1 Tax=Rhodocollybia butyracea TaxID=206335 RepID=A0A9P5UCD0_9AGAR|nr:hypothetical protein BDP27DRAFT_1214976 [Rhodocollybia butyracea]
MDASHNPFSGWAQVGSESSFLRDNNAIASSTFGALPYVNSPPPPASDLVTFYITSYDPDILSSKVIGPNQHRYLHIVTDPNNPRYTVFQNAHGKSVALVEWQSRPLVEIRDVMSKIPARDWLRLTPDGRKSYLRLVNRARTMRIQGARYMWTPQGTYINMYSTDPAPVFLARLSRGHGTIMLDLTNQAIQLGLLDVCLIAGVVMQCGKNID